MMKRFLMVLMVAVFSLTMFSGTADAMDQAKLDNMRREAKEYLDEFDTYTLQYLFDNIDSCKGGEFKIRVKFLGFCELQRGKYRAAVFEERPDLSVFILLPNGYRFKEGTYYTFVAKNYMFRVVQDPDDGIMFESMSFSSLPMLSEYGL